jgi:hypothetical protein
MGMAMGLTIAIVATIALTLPAMERLFLAKEAPDISKFRRRAAYAILISALALNIALTWIQYGNVQLAALKRQKSLERELALNLWAYSNKEERALKYLTSHQSSSTNSYLLGYYYFQHGNDLMAARQFHTAISHGEFVAPSHYVLAMMSIKDDPDLEHAKNDVQAGLDYDADYSSLYVARALIHAMQHEMGAAFKDLDTAVDDSGIHCYTVENGTNPNHPLNILRDAPNFPTLQKKCDAIEKGLDLVEVNNKG